MKMLSQIIKENSFEDIAILKATINANRYLAELKGLNKSMPNPLILVNTLSLQEARDSSEIENIITTQDDIFKYNAQIEFNNPATKEVNNYCDAIRNFVAELQKNNLITINAIIKSQKIIKGNDAGIRVQKGTVLQDELTKKIIYTPPEPNTLKTLLNDLENFINNSQNIDIDPIIKMAIIHHQFESIHPFYDGNGRIGRIINIIYLIQQNLLDTPILYLSRYISHNKTQYYYLLQDVRDNNNWSEWVVFILKAVTKTAQSTINLINEIKKLQQQHKNIIRTNHNKIYSQDLLNNIFKHPYTTIKIFKKDLNVSRATASRYLNQLVKSGLLEKQKVGKTYYYLNKKLVKLLSNIESMKDNYDK